MARIAGRLFTMSVFSLLPLILGCQTCPRQNPVTANADAVLWTQTAAEYESACLTVFQSARRMLEMNLKTEPPAEKQQPAVILDIDETVLSKRRRYE